MEPENLILLGNIYQKVWSGAAEAFKEAAGRAIEMGLPETLEISTSELAASLPENTLTAQFASADHPEQTQVLYITGEEALALAQLLSVDLPETLDAKAAESLQAPIEALIESLCTSLANPAEPKTGEVNISLKVGALTLPDSLVGSPMTFKSTIPSKVEETSVQWVWLQESAVVEGLIELHKPIEDEIGALEEELPIPTTPPVLKIETSETEEMPFSELMEGLDELAKAPTPAGANSGGLSAYATSGNNALQYQDANGLDILLDIPLEVAVELGRVKMLIRDVVDLGQGSIVELDKTAGEPVDVMVNGRLVARGEVVVIEDNFGVRITEILSPAERLKRLGERE